MHATLFAAVLCIASVTPLLWDQNPCEIVVCLLQLPSPCRELITSEIVYWLYQVLTGKDAELLSWPAAASFASQRKQMGLGAGNLQDWVQELLKKVVFKVQLLLLKLCW